MREVEYKALFCGLPDAGTAHSPHPRVVVSVDLVGSDEGPLRSLRCARFECKTHLDDGVETDLVHHRRLDVPARAERLLEL
eukprot:6692590-Prymnesium_polylepis.2